jgi:hypothetical protein
LSAFVKGRAKERGEMPTDAEDATDAKNDAKEHAKDAKDDAKDAKD